MEAILCFSKFAKDGADRVDCDCAERLELPSEGEGKMCEDPGLATRFLQIAAYRSINQRIVNA